jgi:hypothetical protein
MDQGLAAVWAAAIGVVGALTAAGVALYAAKWGAKAQVEAALAGVRAQAEGQRRDAVWSMQREAYSSFLHHAEEVRVGLTSLLTRSAFLQSAPTGDAEAVRELQRELDTHYKSLLLRHSYLSLSVEDEEADRTRQLYDRATEAMTMVGVFADSAFSSPPVVSLQEAQSALGAFEAELAEWIRETRRRQLSS